MWQIDRQNIDLEDLFLKCSGQKESEEVRNHLRIACPVVLDAAAKYEELGRDASLYRFAGPVMPQGGASRDELIDLYETTFARKGGKGRWAYDRIKSSAPHGICPFCGQQPVKTLDHFLPKSRHPVLAITPDNLVPSCRDCNTAKLNDLPTSEGTQSFHPYFDYADDAQWLFATVSGSPRVFATFYVAPVMSWPTGRNERARHHFRVFDLATLYTTQAAVELVNMRDRLHQLFSRQGAGSVRTHLQEEATSRRAFKINSWQSALYQALASDADFYSGAFKAI